MKRIILVALVLLCFFSLTSAFAAGPGGLTAVGLFGSIVGSPTGGTAAPGIGLLFSWNAHPLIGLTYAFAEDGSRIGLFGDWWVWEAPLGGTPLRYWVGVGLFGGMAFGANDTEFDFGARAPIGIRFFPISKFDLFLEFVPMVRLFPQPDLQFAADVGFRVHF